MSGECCCLQKTAVAPGDNKQHLERRCLGRCLWGKGRGIAVGALPEGEARTGEYGGIEVGRA